MHEIYICFKETFFLYLPIIDINCLVVISAVDRGTITIEGIFDDKRLLQLFGMARGLNEFFERFDGKDES